MKKKLKTTEIYYSEGSPTAYIRTFQTSLKNRLVTFSKEYPQVCEITEMEDSGRLSDEIQKDRVSIRLLPPRTAEQRARSRANGKATGFQSKTRPSTKIRTQQSKIRKIRPVANIAIMLSLPR